MKKIWEKYLLREFLKFFALFLFGSYFFYIVIDYCTHTQDLVISKNLSIWKIIQYYLLQFCKRIDILLPLAVLLGTIKTLCQFNVHRELLALQSTGIPKKKFFRPLLVVGTFAVILNLCMNEFAIPYSLNSIDKFHDTHLRHSLRDNRMQSLHVIHLDDHSKLAYQYYDSSKEALFDVIWIRNPDDLWKMRYLKTDPEHPQGEWVDHLERKKEGPFEKTESFSHRVFHDLAWNQDMPRKGYIPFENRSLSELWKLFRTDPYLSSFEKQEILTHLLFKLAMPTLALIVVFAIAPFCTTYKKNFSPFLIYGIAIFSFVAFIAFMDAAVILGESNTLSPYAAILSPFILLISIFGWRFSKSS